MTDPEVLDRASVPELLEFLTSEVPRERADAACALGDRLRCHEVSTLDPPVIEAMAALLEDPVFPVRLEAAIALAEARDQRATDFLLEAIRYRSVRLDAIRALGTLGDPRAVPPLSALMSRWLLPWADRLQAAAALCALGDGRGADYLAEKLGKRRRSERAAAIHFIGESRHPDALRILGDLYRNPHEPMRDVAARALGLLRSAEARKILESERPRLEDELAEDVDAAIAQCQISDGNPSTP